MPCMILGMIGGTLRCGGCQTKLMPPSMATAWPVM